jgi:hypothetical protein
MHVFSRFNFPIFDWNDLKGKTLVIHEGSDSSKDGKLTTFYGEDVETGKLYLLHQEFSRFSHFNPDGEPMYVPPFILPLRGIGEIVK